MKWLIGTMSPVLLVMVILVLLFLSLAVAGGMAPEDIFSDYYFYEPDSIFIDFSGAVDLPNVNSTLAWPTSTNRITSYYGWRIHPIYKDRRFHHGIDIAAGLNAPVYASAPGEVVFAGYHRIYGNLVIVSHGEELKGITTYYAHLNAITISKGEMVKQGEVIGRIGSTGLSTGPHLHFETRYEGKSFNPLLILGR